MQSRTFLRIEGDLVSLVSEVIDREVTLPDLLTELTSGGVTASPRLPTGTRFWIRAGSSDRAVFVVEQAPCRRTITYHASHRYDAEPGRFRLSLPYVVFVVSTLAEHIEGLATYFRTAPIDALDAQLFSSTLPNTSDDGVVCMGSVRVTGATVGERVDALLAAYWASRFNQDLRRHPLPFAGGFRAWAQRSPARSTRGPHPPLRPPLADPPPGRGGDGRALARGPAGRTGGPPEPRRHRGPDPRSRRPR